ncbi:putative dual-specificity RNA methyltransferase RlmN [bacterium HR11]|nr:putative dual-specificity RNA methyltransferase RlmN [bacterium HR11]
MEKRRQMRTAVLSVQAGRVALIGMTRAELRAWATAQGWPAYRGDQLFMWLYARQARSFDGMTDLPRALREALTERAVIEWPEPLRRDVADDGTVKYVLRLTDGAVVETVFMPRPDGRATVCVSTQVGCPMGCRFCVTGAMGFGRNLTAGEIVGQVLVVRADHPEVVGWNVVLMGMGEPLLNLDAVEKALDILWDPRGLGIGPRHTTVSTVGIVPGIRRLMTRPVRPRLAVSLHAPEPALRARLVPVERKYGLFELMQALREVPLETRREWVTIEYTLIGGVNDRPEHARRLARLVRPLRCKVNLIPYNPAPIFPLEEPTPEAVEAFARILRSHGLTVTVRQNRGRRVMAACGQLGYEFVRPEARGPAEGTTGP